MRIIPILPDLLRYCDPYYKLDINIFSIGVITEIMVTTLICIAAFVWLRFLLPGSDRLERSRERINTETSSFSLSTSIEEEDVHAAAVTNARYKAFAAITDSIRYLVVYVVCWTPRLIFEFESIRGIDSSWFLKILAQFMLSSIGFWNSMVYGTMPPEYQFQRLWFHAIGCCFRITQKVAPTATTKHIVAVRVPSLYS